MDIDEILGRIAASEHLALTALNLYVHARAGVDGEDPVETARIIADGMLATYADAVAPDRVRAFARRELRAQGAALVNAAQRLADAARDAGLT